MTLYNILINIAAVHVKLIASFKPKLKLGTDGRKQTFSKIKQVISFGDKTIWLHCASLGEYEQGLPIFQEVIKDHPGYKVVLSFFSPSGYEIKKNSSIADMVVYLPLDTLKNANRFVELVNPDLVIFVKNEVWPNYLKVLKSRSTKTILISAIFRQDQIHFKWYGKLMRQALSSFDHIFVQDKKSKELLESIGLNNTSVSGDTRFDRVGNQLNIDNQVPHIEKFKGEKLCMVAGSTWPEDESVLIEYINQSPEAIKFIVAPHNIKQKQIKSFQNDLKVNSILYSEISEQDLEPYQVLIIDSIGLLSKLYSYADMAYVGGAMGKTGLHNTLEPAIFGLPIIIGKNHIMFPEAKAMIDRGGMFEIQGITDFNKIITKLVDYKDVRNISGTQNLNFIKENQGAVIHIMDYLRKYG